MLTHAELLEALDYDPATGVFRWKWRPGICNSVNARQVGKTAGCICPLGYLQIRINGKLYLAQRLAWFYVTGKWPTENIDHKNGNAGDNRFENLREATQGQNLRNTAKRSDNISGVKGVSWDAYTGKWRATITKDGRTIRLGRFKDVDEAAIVRRAACDRIHGEFARHG